MLPSKTLRLFSRFFGLTVASAITAVAISVIIYAIFPSPAFSQRFSDVDFLGGYEVFLEGGQGLHKRESVISELYPVVVNGRGRAENDYFLVLQDDGNLVLYYRDWRGGRTEAIWDSGTSGEYVEAAIMQKDGNFVIYGSSSAIWATGTDGNPGARLAVQEDGNVVIYSPSNRPLWSAF